MDVPDVYITAQQASFLSTWACQSDPNLSGWDVIYEVSPLVRPPLPNEEHYECHVNQDTYDEGEFFQETRLSKKRFKNRSTPPQNIEVDNDSESDFTPEPEQEEVTAADDLSMLERLRKGGLPHVDAFIDDDEHVITDSDDDDAFIDLEAFIDDEE